MNNIPVCRVRLYSTKLVFPRVKERNAENPTSSWSMDIVTLLHKETICICPVQVWDMQFVVSPASKLQIMDWYPNILVYSSHLNIPRACLPNKQTNKPFSLIDYPTNVGQAEDWKYLLNLPGQEIKQIQTVV